MKDFNELKAKILPSFIKYYGIEYAQLIIDRLNKIEPIFYETINEKKIEISELRTKKKIELTLELLKNFGFDVKDEDKNKMFNKNSFKPLEQYPDILNFLNICFNENGYNEFEFSSIRKFKMNDNYFNYSIFKKFRYDFEYDRYDEFLKSQVGIEAYNNILRILSCIDNLDLEYQKFQEQYKDIDDEINNIKIKSGELTNKRTLEFYEEIINFLNEKDKKLIEDYKNGSIESFNFLLNKLDIFELVGNLNYEKGYLEAFLNENTYKQIEYYKFIGVYNGAPVNEFLESEIALKYKPDIKKIKEIYSIKEKYVKQNKEESFIMESSYNKNINQINDLYLLTKPTEKTKILEKMMRQVMFINPNVIKTENGLDTKSILFFSPSLAIEKYVDVSLIHEINHVIELSLLDYNEGKAIYKSGFSILNDFDDSISYELFNEYINQRIAIEITEEMHNDNVYLFDNSNLSRTRGSTSYEQVSEVADYFFETFKDVILKSRLENNLNSLFEIISEEKFNQLNNIILEFNNIPYHQLSSDLRANKTTELTTKREELIRESVEIVNQMLEHRKQNSR